MNLPRLCVQRPIATAMTTFIVVIIGIFALTRLPIDLLPDVALPTVTVRANYGNASPEEMERLVAEPIEETMALISGVDEITSESGQGSANVRVRFVWGTNLDAATNDVRERLDRITDDLPEDMPKPEVQKFDIANMPVMLLGVSSALDPIEMTRVLEDQVLYRLQSLPGVAAVDIWGSFQREIRIELDLGKVQALRLPLNDVLEAIESANVNLPAGSIERGRYEETVRTPGEFTSLEQLSRTVVAVRERGPIQLRDIAVIRDTYQDLTRIIRINGEQGVRLAVRKQSDANTARVAARVLKEIELLNAELPQFRIISVINQGQYIERAIANVGQSILYGGALAVLVLLAFLRNLRSTLVIAVAIPISVIATFAVVFFGGFTLNLMTLGGLALGIGMMVDNSIVVLENIYRRRHEDHEDRAAASIRGSGEVATAITASTITTLVIFLPLAFVEGVSGVLFQQLAIVVAFSLVVSLFVALSVVPMLASRLLRRELTPAPPTSGVGRLIHSLSVRAGVVLNAIERTYANILQDAVRFRFLTILLASALVVGSVMLIPRLGTEFIPPSDEGEVRVTGEMEVGTRLSLVDAQTKVMEALTFPHVPEIEGSVVSVGASGYNPDDASEGEIQISLKPARERSRSNVEIAEDLRRRLENAVPGMTIRTRAPQGQRMLERLLGGQEGLDIEVRGYDLAVLDLLAAEASRSIADVPGITDVRVSREAGVPQQMIRINRDKAADLGVSVRRIAQTLETSLSGTRAGEFREDGNEYRILVRLRDARQLALAEVLDITLRNDAGEDVALRNLVDVEPDQGPLVIDRKDRQRIATVSANITGRDLGSIAEDVQARLAAIPRPTGYEFVLAGSYEEQQRAFRELLFTFALAVLLVYMVLACQYESLRDPLIVMVSVPTAAIGVVAILFLTRTTLNVQSYIGCIMLGGIVVNNAILLVDQAGRLRRDSGLSPQNAVMEAARRRMRPILMTSLTTILGLLPLALGLGEGAQAQAPLARAVVGGLLFSTLVTLVLVPAVYTLFHPERTRE